MDYSKLISVDNLFQAWSEFRKGKKKRNDVQRFERHLEDNLFNLHKALRDKTYRHGNYQSFYVQDPKQRHIHKANVQDRVVHHLLYNYLYKLFDKTFIYDSYSCRLNKGTHKAANRLEQFTRKVSGNYTRSCWVLKCDIKKFFSSIDHSMLIALFNKKIKDEDIIWLLKQAVESFPPKQPDRLFSACSGGPGMPLGNLTSQIFANIYLNELDQFIKHKLKIKYYLRYADDFLLLSPDKNYLYQYIDTLKIYLKNYLKLQLHPEKVFIRKLEWGIDFLGYIVLPHYTLPRTKTRRRMFKKLKEKISTDSFNQALQSYLGYLQHANSFELTQSLKNRVWFWKNDIIGKNEVAL